VATIAAVAVVVTVATVAVVAIVTAVVVAIIGRVYGNAVISAVMIFVIALAIDRLTVHHYHAIRLDASGKSKRQNEKKAFHVGFFQIG
jgi:energy-coupling factor transporter transmembrane protein EcfT